ncbi:MAG: hypothetical protein K0Q97_1143 [Bacillota bacterium]|jgi:hypothetical protein|nr:hypothetical protein [Bacillota bacterium]
MANIFKNFDDENKKGSQNNQNNKSKNVTNKKPNNLEDVAANDQFNQFKEKYKDKSEDDILKDAKEYSKKLKEQYGEEEYQKKVQELKKFEMFLTPDQKKKMKKFLDGLK